MFLFCVERTAAISTLNTWGVFSSKHSTRFAQCHWTKDSGRATAQVVSRSLSNAAALVRA
jgi:hypothetical protein